MTFSTFISTLGLVWGCYYLLIILFDLLKTSNQPAEVTAHHVQFEPENPVLINDETIKTNHLGYNDKSFNSHQEYLPKENRIGLNEPDTSKCVLVDLGLETISGEPYEVSAENLSKYMRA